MIVTTKELFAAAYGRYAVGAYNINNLEQTMGLFQGNLDSQAPFIIQISKGARSYTDKRMLEGIIRAADEVFPEAIFAVHLDHGDYDACMDCIASGFYSSVMIDASGEPLEENIRITREIVEAAHAKGIVVEAELGQLGGVEEHVQVDEKNANLTDPEEAKIFVEGSGCDSLAVAIGTSHGAYKFSGDQALRLDVLAEIQKRLPDFPLVMHGSSSVPQEEVQRINDAGGALKAPKVSTRMSSSRPYRWVSPRSTSTPTAALSGRAYIASSSWTSPRSSIYAIRARSSWRNTPSSSPIRTRSWVPPVVSKR